MMTSAGSRAPFKRMRYSRRASSSGRESKTRRYVSSYSLLQSQPALNHYPRCAQVDLPSFWEVWRRGGEMRAQLLAAADPHEAKWALQKQHGYKLGSHQPPRSTPHE